MKLLESLSKKVLTEVSEKVKNQLYSKYSNDTSDGREKIMSYIDLFDRYKDSLPATKRDITRYTYDELKSVIDTKQSLKQLTDVFNQFKKKEKGIENTELKKYIKKFMEIKSELPKEFQDIYKLSFSDLTKLINKLYTTLLTKKLTDKFLKENPNLTADQVTFYIDDYNENFDIIPFETKGIDKMSFNELEHLLDGLENKKDISNKKEDTADINLKYDQNNLKIFAPKTKDQCIRLKNNRGWCTSRSGGGNMYYNYRLGSQRTLYYVIDEDMDFDDLNFATVILVNPNGEMSMADKSNSGRYGGSTNIPWSEIVSKVPKLEGLKDIFKPEPLTQEENDLINLVRNKKVGDNPMKSFNNPQEVEMWLEYNSPNLSDIQYINLIPDLKKKYIALGMDLSSKMIQSSEPEVLKYYISKKIDGIKNKDIGSLSNQEISLLEIPLLKKVKDELKTKFRKTVSVNNNNEFIIDNFTSGPVANFIRLYGLGDLFVDLPKTLLKLIIHNRTNEDIIVKIPDDIGNYKELNTVILDNCIDTITDSVCKLPNLRFLTLINNKGLTSIPDCIATLPKLIFFNARGSTNLELPQSIKDNGTDMGGGMWDLEN